MMTFRICFALMCVLLASCQLLPDNAIPDENHVFGSEHLTEASRHGSGSIPKPVTVLPPALPKPKPITADQRLTVVVHDVPVTELLFSIARDAGVNLDIESGIDKKVTINAIRQPFYSIIDRITEKTGLRYELSEQGIYIRKDQPFLQSYRVDYLNMERVSASRVSVSTQIASTGQGAVGDAGGEGNNSSDTSVTNKSSHSFWLTLHGNIASIIGGGGEGAGGSASHPDIIFNRESGILAVRATQRQHKDIAAFINEVSHAAQRQVLIEATIVEVTLSDRYQAGIDWEVLKATSENGVDRSISQNMIDVALNDPAITISHIGRDLAATVKALNTFGDVSVMSSPKVMTLNNQTALLKVVDNLVYFTVDVNVETSDTGPSTITFETEVNTVPIGFVMSVTPFVNEYGYVTLNIRPTISRVIGLKRDPNPALAEQDVINEIPEIQVREVESVLKIPDGEVAIIGGLMQDEKDNLQLGVPLLSRIPWLGRLFKYQDDLTKKSELVIFIKPVVVEYDDASSARISASRSWDETQ